MLSLYEKKENHEQWKKERIKGVRKIWWEELTNGRATNSFKRYLVTGEGPGD